MRALLILLLLLPCSALAKPLVADLSRYRIEIDSSFTGTRLLLFGARNDTGDVVVVVRGPDEDFVVRKKKRIAGIWMNHEEQHFDHVPGFYAIASSKPFKDMHDLRLFSPLNIGLERVIEAGGNGSFAPELLHYEQSRMLYSNATEKVSFMGESLFKFMIHFPDNIPGGNYSADVYLFNDGHISGMQSIPLRVDRTGFDAMVYDFAHTHSGLYGLLAVMLALGVGWGASTIMQKL